MDNDKNELLYVMKLLKNTPPKNLLEISKELSSFKFNKKFQFNIKPDSKFELESINSKNCFITNNNSDPIQNTETINESENLLEKNSSSINTISSKQIKIIKSQKTSSILNYKPNLNIRKFSNIQKSSILNKEIKSYNKNFNNAFKNPIINF